LAVGVVVLIVAAAVLTRSLLSIPVEVPDVPQAKQPVKPEAPKVTETVIDAATVPEVPKKAQPKPPPLEPLVVESPKTTVASSEPAPQSPSINKVGIAEVLSLRGTAMATGTNKIPRKLFQGARLSMNETIETAPSTKLKIKFDDGSVLSQGENSSILIDEYVYDPNKPPECGFAMRIIKGTCRVVTGLITKTNPDRFRVRTRMATVGIRGCDVAFRSKQERDDVYVLDLAGEKKVVITAAKDGSPLVDLVTGKDLPIEESRKQSVDIVEGGNQVSVLPGKGIVEQRQISQDELREVVTETSYLPPAQHNLTQSPDGATFTIQPKKEAPKSADTPATDK
jgi:hypothetical protein